MDFLFPLLLALLFVPLFLSFRKQRRQFAEMQQLQSSLTPGDRVMTTSGVYATVVGMDDDTIDLEIAPGTVTTWARRAIAERLTTDSDDATDDADEADAHDAAHDPAENGADKR